MGPTERRWLHSRSRRKALAALAGLAAGSPLVRSGAAAQLDPRPLKEHRRLPGLDEMATAFDFEPVMFANIPLSVYDYTAHGDGSEFTLRRNRQVRAMACAGIATVLRHDLRHRPDVALRDGKFSETVQLAAQGLRSFPDDEHLRFLQAEALYELNQYAAARQILAGLINEPHTWHFRAGTPSHIQEKLAPRRLADVLRLQGDYSAAERLLLEILDRFPNDTISWHALGQLYIQSNQWPPLEKVARHLRDCPQGDVFADLLLVTWHLSHGEFDPAERHIEGLIGRVPQMPLPRLMRAELLIRRGAPRQSLIQACRDLLRVQPGNAEGARILARLENAQQAIAVTSADNGCMSVVLGAGIPSEFVISQGCK
jgi:predicted Zn-dependent protease